MARYSFEKTNERFVFPIDEFGHPMLGSLFQNQLTYRDCGSLNYEVPEWLKKGDLWKWAPTIYGVVECPHCGDLTITEIAHDSNKHYYTTTVWCVSCDKCYKICYDCLTPFIPKQPNHKTCASCHADWIKQNSHKQEALREEMMKEIRARLSSYMKSFGK